MRKKPKYITMKNETKEEEKMDKKLLPENKMAIVSPFISVITLNVNG